MFAVTNHAQPHQGLLSKHLHSLFDDIHENIRKTSTFKYDSGGYMEFDLWIPKHSVCFEFQDAYHYVTIWYANRSIAEIQNKDTAKRVAAHKKGYNLIIIPCWWDGTKASLIASINFQRPDLLEGHHQDPLIELNPPLGFFQSMAIPDVGELMLASFAMDANFNNTFQNNTWWMGEKYDGIRCCWHPHQKTLYARSGREVLVLASMTRLLPRQFLDCEIWFGRGQYSLVYSLINESHSLGWESLRMLNFDDPSFACHRLPFEERYEHLLNLSDDHPFALLAVRMLCRNKKHLSMAVQTVIDHAGEGIILRKRNSVYKQGRSHSLIKLKAAQGDKEAIVTKITNEFVELRLPNGITFQVPSSDVHISSPDIGDVVTFSYDSWARRELPVSPKIYRVRTDLAWTDVVQSDVQEKQLLNDKSMVPDFSSHAFGHWTAKRARLFLESYAKSRNMDPLVAETWYTMPPAEIRSVKGADSIFTKGGGYFKTLRALFPDIGLDATQFLRNQWKDITHRRIFFEKYAQANSFDPYIAQNWYSQAVIDGVFATKGHKGVLLYHDKSISQALLDLFPNVAFDKNQVPIPNKFRKTKARIKFFEDYAAAHKFDPLIPSNWYTQTREQLYSFKGAHEVASFHKRSIIQALVDLFPNIGLQRSRFPIINPWKYAGYRKRFFETYAKENDFDPLVPENWYRQSMRRILDSKKAQHVVKYHEGSVPQALMDLFPNIGLVKANFSRNWRSAKRLRKFFEEYAKQKNFNPHKPQNWYLQPVSSFLSFQGGAELMAHCNNNMAKALLAAFPNIGLDPVTFATIAPWNEPAERRKFFNSYAAQHCLDPLVPDAWYHHDFSNLMHCKGVKEVLFYHNGNVAQALIDLFPDIGLRKSAFFSDQRWESAENRKTFFKFFAADMKFDPNVPENWYNHSADIMAQKGANSVMSYHQGSVSQALLDLFPNINLQPDIFLRTGGYQEASARRQFFESFAAQHDFDALVPDNWYSVKPSRIAVEKGASFVLDHHDHSMAEALAALFPDVTFDRRLFAYQYRDEIKRRELFKQFAKHYLFDPLIATNWYPHVSSFSKYPGATMVLTYYMGSVIKALSTLFPGVSFDKSKFHYPSQIWQNSENRRKLFERYAAANNFDPLLPENWYAQPRLSVLAFKGARAVLEYHKKSVSRALLELFPDIGLDPIKFESGKLWNDTGNRRKVFESYAIENKFNPSDPEKWYIQHNAHMLSFKGLSGVLRYYNYNIPKALMELFPEIGLVKSKFRLK